MEENMDMPYRAEVKYIYANVSGNVDIYVHTAVYVDVYISEACIF